MIHIVTPEKRPEYIKELGEMFLKRNMAGDYGFDFKGINQDAQDVFDTPEAVYILYTENSKIEGGVRLLPTVGLHILDGGCSGLFDPAAKFPPDKKIWECSRFFFNTTLSAKEGEKIAKSIFQGILEFCMAQEIYHLTAVFSQKIHQTLLHFGWPLRIISQSTTYDVISSLILVFQDCANFIAYKASQEAEKQIRDSRADYGYSQHPVYKLEKIKNELQNLNLEKQKIELELREKLIEDLIKCNALSVPYETLLGGILEIIATHKNVPEKALEWKTAGQKFIFPESPKASKRNFEENVYTLHK
jgi:N-acyl-L-homoserine lactone synthetase